MAEILICIRSGVSTDFYVNCGLPKRGDVIAIGPDNNNWSGGELSNPDWRIVRLVGVSVAALSSFLTQEPSTTAPQPGTIPGPTTRQYRGFMLDFDDANVPPAVKLALADDARATPIYVIPNATVLAGKIRKARQAIPDPAIIASDPSVIG